MKLYIVRHGQRDFGVHFDRLLTQGLWQAKKIGQAFKDKKIDFIYCSPQYRARQTLEGIKPCLKKNIPIKISHRVRQKGSPEEVGPSAMRIYNLKKDTDEQVDKRVRSFLKMLFKKHPKDNVLVISHKEITRQFVKVITPKYSKYDNEDIKILSGSISTFEFDSNNKLKNYNINKISYSEKQNKQIGNAFILAREAHKGQKQVTGKPYIEHPSEVGRMLASWRQDYEVICAGYLHDVVEDTKTSLSKIKKKFGKRTANLVGGMSWIRFKDKTKGKDWHATYKKFSRMSKKDPSLVLIKAADMISNIPNIHVKSHRKFVVEKSYPRNMKFYVPFLKEAGLRKATKKIERAFHKYTRKKIKSVLNDYISKKDLRKIRDELNKIKEIEELR